MALQYHFFQKRTSIFWLAFVEIPAVGSWVPLDVRAGLRAEKVLQDHLVFNTFLSSGFVLLPHLMSTLVTKAIAAAKKELLSFKARKL